MSWSISYNNTWKWVAIDWTTMQTFYGEDFNPNLFTFPSSRSSVSASWQTTSFDLSWFQVWNEVGVHVFEIQPSETTSWTIYSDFLRYDWSWWSTMWTTSWNWPFQVDYIYWYYSYWWVDDDEIRPWYTKYKCHIYWPWSLDFYSPEFTVSNLSFDDTLHDPWYLWVEWSYLCYTDWIWWESWNWNKWYKHKIKYDSNFSEYVWTNYSWKIWLETDVVRRIYYVDQYWYKRRTYEASNWFGYPSWQWRNVGSDKKGKLRTPWVYDWWEYWYWHLCFVNQWWYLMRILNWNPNS